MPTSTYSRAILLAASGASLLAAPGSAGEGDPDKTPGYTRTHESSVVLDPESLDEGTEEAGSGSSRFRVIRSEIDSPEWLDAAKRARRHVSGRGSYTLLRVILEDADEEERIQAQATKLKELTDEYHGGGGEYRVVSSGDFLFIEHINSAQRRDGRDPVLVGSPSHGTTRLWIDVSPDGELGLVGDVVLRRPEEVGRLSVEVDAPPGVKATTVMLGPVVVGGPYGQSFSLDRGGRVDLPLSPGTYKLLLPEFHARRDRWDVEVVAGMTTRIRLAALSQRDLRKAGERRELYPFPSPGGESKRRSER